MSEDEGEQLIALPSSSKKKARKGKAKTQEEAEAKEEPKAEEAAEAAKATAAGKRPLPERAQLRQAKAEAILAEGKQRTRLARAPAWVDRDDEEVEVDVSSSGQKRFRRNDEEGVIKGEEYVNRLRNKFAKSHGNVSWVDRDPKAREAELSAEEDEDEPQDREAEEEEEDEDEEGDELPASSMQIIQKKGRQTLKPRQLGLKRLKDIRTNPKGHLLGPADIRVLNFHPSSDLLMTAGLDKTVRLWTIDGEENTKVSSYHFKNFPICEASFTPNGERVALLGLNENVRTLDVRTGESSTFRPMTTQSYQRFRHLAMGPNPEDKAGLKSSRLFAVAGEGVAGDGNAVLILDAISNLPVKTVYTSSRVTNLVFSPERDVLFGSDEECNLYQWDVSTGRCLQKIKEPWAVKITKLAVSRVTSHNPRSVLAVGTHLGNVDLYDLSGPSLTKEPFKNLDNLTTWVGSLRFHPSGEMLGMASSNKQDQLKLAHMGTTTVYENWPTFKTPLGKVTSLDFSRHGGYMAIGNHRGRVLLYTLKHYSGENN